MVTFNDVKQCPIATAFFHIGKKWTINILRDMMIGRKQFTQFLESNPGMSAKMLSQRLHELQSSGLIEKKITNGTPVVIEYVLTQRGKDLDKILYELSIFSMKNYPSEVFKSSAKQLNVKEFSRLTKAVMGV